MSQCIIKAGDGVQADLEADVCQEENQTGAEKSLDETSSVSCGTESKDTVRKEKCMGVESFLQKNSTYSPITDMTVNITNLQFPFTN